MMFWTNFGVLKGQMVDILRCVQTMPRQIAQTMVRRPVQEAVSGAAREVHLSPRFKHHHRNAVGQVEAAVAGAHGQAQALFGWQLVQYVGGQAAGFGARCV